MSNGVSSLWKNEDWWAVWFAAALIGLESNFRELAGRMEGGKPLVLYVVGQSFNLILALVVVMLAAVAGFFSSGVTPPGPAGEVLRHNQSCDIDASPLFYSEVENMHELEQGLARMMGGRGERDQSGAKNE